MLSSIAFREVPASLSSSGIASSDSGSVLPFFQIPLRINILIQIPLWLALLQIPLWFNIFRVRFG